MFRIDRSFRFDSKIDPDTGYMRISGVASQVGLLEYGKADGMEEDGVIEFVPPKTLVDSVKGMVGLPITDDHPPEMLDAGNTSRFQVGQIVEARIDGEGDDMVIRVEALITDEATIRKIQAGKKELSPGYHCQTDGKSGRWNGKKFHESQVGRKHNHLALVDFARAGRTNRFDQLAVRYDGLLVQIGANMAKEENKNDESELVSYELEGVEFQVPRPVVEEISMLRGKIESSEDNKDEEEDNKDEGDDENEDAEKDEDKMKDKKDGFLKQISALVDQKILKMEARQDAKSLKAQGRMDAISMVKPNLPQSYICDGKSTEQILLDAIRNKSDSGFARAKPHKDNAGILTGIFLGLESTKRADGDKSGDSLSLDSGTPPVDMIAEARARQDNALRGKKEEVK